MAELYWLVTTFLGGCVVGVIIGQISVVIWHYHKTGRWIREEQDD